MRLWGISNCAGGSLEDPLIRRQPVDRSFDTLLDGVLWNPSVLSYFARVEIDEGVISDPPPIPTAEFQFGRKAEFL